MQVTLESTTKIVELIINDVAVPARIWEGVTAKGIKCHAYITRIAVHKEDDAGEFAADLREHRAPRNPDVGVIPSRLVP